MTQPIQNQFPSCARDVDRIVRREMKTWSVPGAAIGVIAGDRLLHAGGYSQRHMRRSWPVTEHTLFSIGSCTKTFTATAAAMLVDEGVLDWDRPVRQYMPSFRLADPVATRQATLRDLLSHQVGLAPHTNLNPQDSRTHRLAQLRHLAFARPFRSGYLYNNKMYLVVGALIERVSGMPWEDFVRTRILQPLGMTSSCFASELPWRPDHAPAAVDLAVGYLSAEGRKQPWFQGWARNLTLADVCQSCGADQTIHSSLSDMCRWLQVQVNGGRVGHRRLLSLRQLRQMRTPQVSAASAPWVTGGDLASTQYGLGWVLQTWRGRQRIFHGGAGYGCTSRISFLPEEGIGVVAMCNTYAIPFLEAVTLSLFDKVLGLEPRRWSAQLKQRARQRERQAKETPARTHPGHPGPGESARALGAYAGRYRNPGYGELSVALEKGQMRMCYGPVIYRMRHSLDDTFEIREQFAGSQVLSTTFRRGRAGAIASIAVPFESAVPAIVFRRVER